MNALPTPATELLAVGACQDISPARPNATSLLRATEWRAAMAAGSGVPRHGKPHPVRSMLAFGTTRRRSPFGSPACDDDVMGGAPAGSRRVCRRASPFGACAAQAALVTPRTLALAASSRASPPPLRQT